MSNDGATEGIVPTRALGTILGNDPPPREADGMELAAMRQWLLTAPSAAEFPVPPAVDEEGQYYDECTRVVAGELLRWAEEHPEEYARTTMETLYDWEGDPHHGAEGMLLDYVVSWSAYDLLKERGVPLGRLGITGFMWGWAWNAVARVMGRDPSPNPAIVTLES